MSNVTLRIGGREYKVACGDGEEQRLLTLGRLIDDKARASGMAGQSEARMLLFAALLLADENHELNCRMPKQTAMFEDADSASENEAANPERLTAIADRLENLASLLESAPTAA
jgi:cell division protein ZapA